MTKPSGQKKKLLCLSQILLQQTDEDHGLTMTELLTELERYDITADRKAIYQDLDVLRDFGLDIIGEKHGRSYRYYIGSRDFELPELKLLVDAVQSAKFISEKKSQQLIGKLEQLASVHQARQLQRQVLITNRVKTLNESIYYNVDELHTAINRNRRVRFQYFQWNVKKEMVLRHDGARYDISPWYLMWDDENYYLVGYDHTAEMIKHYRVDKMLRIEISDAPRCGAEHFKDFSISAYTKSIFGMYGGEQKKITLVCREELAGVLIDRFGKDVLFYCDTGQEAQHLFTAVVDVAVSRQFLSWIIALGSGVRIAAPAEVIEQMRKIAREMSAAYLRNGEDQADGQ